MRKSRAGFALFENESNWLLHWSNGWKAYSLIGGHVEANESFLECARREASEELELSHDMVSVKEEPVVSIFFEGFSESAKCQTAYDWQVFEARFVAETVSLPDNCVWATGEMIGAYLHSDGKPIAAQVKRLHDAVNARRTKRI